ncbi:MAG: uncharacterized membrane protein YuzA (DUF378 family) [Sphingobacteriales bacterium]|jgi:uncharacterized membrane protein YuzA (DUF378 family)
MLSQLFLIGVGLCGLFLFFYGVVKRKTEKRIKERRNQRWRK